MCNQPGIQPVPTGCEDKAGFPVSAHCQQLLPSKQDKRWHLWVSNPCEVCANPKEAELPQGYSANPPTSVKWGCWDLNLKLDKHYNIFKRVGDEGGEAKKHPLQIKTPNKTAANSSDFLTVSHSSYPEQGNTR